MDWLALLCDKFELCPLARQLSITLMDYFMDKFDIDESQLKLVALGSLLVAGTHCMCIGHPYMAPAVHLLLICDVTVAYSINVQNHHM